VTAAIQGFDQVLPRTWRELLETSSEPWYRPEAPRTEFFMEGKVLDSLSFGEVYRTLVRRQTFAYNTPRLVVGPIDAYRQKTGKVLTPKQV